MKDLPYGARVKDLDGHEGTVVAISKDGGKFRLVDWDDGTRNDKRPREELTALPVDLFDRNDDCKVCGHMKGDHEQFPGTEVWTCDDDCNEDLNGYCHVGRL